VRACFLEDAIGGTIVKEGSITCDQGSNAVVQATVSLAPPHSLYEEAAQREHKKKPLDCTAAEKGISWLCGRQQRVCHFLRAMSAPAKPAAAPAKKQSSFLADFALVSPNNTLNILNISVCVT
jgi:hypothetical protein